MKQDSPANDFKARAIAAVESLAADCEGAERNYILAALDALQACPIDPRGPEKTRERLARAVEGYDAHNRSRLGDRTITAAAAVVRWLPIDDREDLRTSGEPRPRP